MSTMLMGLCWPLQMEPAAKAVLVSLADQANDHGYCWPSIGTLAMRTCLSERTVQRAVRLLEGLGLIRSEIGAMKSNRYVLQAAALQAAFGTAKRPKYEAKSEPVMPDLATTPVTVSPVNFSTTPVMVSPTPRHHDTLTIIEPNTNTTPQTPRSTDGPKTAPSEFSASGQEQASATAEGLDPVGLPETGNGRRGKTGAVCLATFLAECRAAGQKPILETDAVFAYAGRVGLSGELLTLCWREFKDRQLTNGARQRDWRAKFRNCVQANWYGLWFMPAGEEARLSSKGEQAQRNFAALDAEKAAAGGDDKRGEK